MKVPHVGAKIAVAALAVLWIGVAAAASDSTSKPKKKASGASQRVPQRVDADAESLRKGYAGESIRDVIRLFSVSPKDEFEATAAYEARVAKLPFGAYAVRVEEAAVVYDADAGVMRIEVANDLAYAEDPMKRQYEFKSDVQPTGSYVGQNAYGAKATITTARTTRVRVVDKNSTADEPEKLVCEFTAPAAEARLLKPSLRVLLLLSIDPDDVKSMTYDKRRMPATVASPYEFTVEEHKMRASVLGLWAVDPSTGRILCRGAAY